MKKLLTGKCVFFIMLLALSFNILKAQDEILPVKPKIPFRERIFTGGNLGLQFGSVTYVDVSPKVGYKITDRAAAGIGATYIYISDKRVKGYEYNTDIYGGRVFSQYQVLENVMAYSEFEVLNAEVQNEFYPFDLSRKNISSFLVGGGYVQAIGQRSNAVILVLWNLLESRYSIYQNPVIRIGFNIGF